MDAQVDPALTQAPQHLRQDFPTVTVERGAEAELTWYWTGEPRWMNGVAFTSGETFFNSIARGRYLTGSAVGPDGDMPIDIVLSTEETTLAQVFRRDQGWAPVGVGTFPGAVYDVSDPDNPRRLNVAISEDDRQGEANMMWDPSTATDGKREYLWVMASDYDGTGETYADVNIASDADELDLLYIWEARVEPGRTFFESDPATLSIALARITDFAAEPGNGMITLSWSYAAPPEVSEIAIYRGLTSPASERVGTVAADQTSFDLSIADPYAEYHFRAEALDADGNVMDISAEIMAVSVIGFNMSVLGTLNPRSNYGDIWGHVDPATGREYALMTARSSGLSIIDVTAMPPVEVAFVPGIADPKDVKTYGTYAYLVNEDAPIQIIDIADPANPAQVATLDTEGGDGGSHNILVEGDYLYVIGGDARGLRIYDLATPASPALVGTLFVGANSKYYHDVEVRNDTLYAAAIYDQGVDIVDVADKSNPSLISTFIYAATSMGAHNICSTESGSYVFVGDEIGSGTWTRVFDVRDPFNVEQVADIIVEQEAPVHNCYVKDDLLYIAHYSEGTRVFDVSDPEEPVEVAFYDTHPEPGASFAGNWTVYPYLPSNRLISSDRERGLFVLQLDLGTVDAEAEGVLPADGFVLESAYPNPTTGNVTVPFLLANAAQIRLTVFDVLGREVAVLADDFRPAGSHAVTLDGSNLPSGAYFYRLDVAGAASQTRPLTIVR